MPTLLSNKQAPSNGKVSGMRRNALRLRTWWQLSSQARGILLDLLILALILWVAHYLQYHQLGLYEDDYAQISQPLGWKLADLSNYLRVVATWPQGRPLHYLLPHALAFGGGKLGGLSTVYILGFLIQTTNAFLFYSFLRRVGMTDSACIGAAVFGLFPADTTHVLLVHALGAHTSLTFLLLASHWYLSGHKAWAHALSLGCLLTYETPYMVFLAMPLVGRPLDRPLRRETRRHLAAWLGVLLVMVAIRILVGEDRIEAVGTSLADLGTIITRTLAAMVIGPAVSLSLFGIGPAWTLSNWRPELSWIFLGSLPAFAWVLRRVRFGVAEDKTKSRLAPGPAKVSRGGFHPFSIPAGRMPRLLLASFVMVGLAYGLSFTHYPPTAQVGRATSVHLAASFGGALLFACLCAMLLAWARSRRRGFLGIGLLALYLSLLVAYRFSIQLDFAQAWQNQQVFWRQAIEETPDFADGTLIFVLEHDLPRTRFILTNSWADPIVLQQIFRFPSRWETAPRLFVVPADWTESVVRDGDQLTWEVPPATWKAHWETLPDSNVILLEMQNGKLVRRFGSIMIQGRAFRLKPLPPMASRHWKEGTLYPLLIRGTE
jgi:hypothetical protein